MFQPGLGILSSISAFSFIPPRGHPSKTGYQESIPCPRFASSCDAKTMGCLPQHISILRLISKLRVQDYSPRKFKLGGVIKLMLGKRRWPQGVHLQPLLPFPGTRETLGSGTGSIMGGHRIWVLVWMLHFWWASTEWEPRLWSRVSWHVPLSLSFFLRSIDEPALWGSTLPQQLASGISVCRSSSQQRDFNWVVSTQPLE